MVGLIGMCAFACAWSNGRCVFLAEFAEGTAKQEFKIYNTVEEVRAFRDRVPDMRGCPANPLRIDVFLMLPADAKAFDSAPMKEKYDFFCRHGLRVHDEETEEEELEALFLYGVIEDDKRD
jgi:hypothetical protein